MPRKKTELFDFLDAPGVKILKNLRKEGSLKYSDLLNLSGISKGNFNVRINAFLKKFHLVEIEYDYQSRRPLYKLTPLGLKVLEKLEEIEKIYEEEMKKVPPKEPEEFLKGEEE